MTSDPRRLLTATSADLPGPVAAALASPTEPTSATVEAAGLRWWTRTWGVESAPPVLLVHGVTSDGGTFWRIGPALAAAGRRVLAVDLPGHGRTGGWTSRHRFRQTAQDLSAFIAAAGLHTPDLTVLGHSWGGMVVAALPAVGLRPRRLILLDPPALPVATMEALTLDPQEQRYGSVDAAMTAVRAAEPAWSDGDVRAKADALTRFDPQGVRQVLAENGDWDAGLSELPVAVAAGVPVWILRGEERAGGMIPDAFVPKLARVVGPDRVVTIAGAPHSPQRTFPAATVLAILRALEDDSVPAARASRAAARPTA